MITDRITMNAFEKNEHKDGCLHPERWAQVSTQYDQIIANQTEFKIDFHNMAKRMFVDNGTDSIQTQLCQLSNYCNDMRDARVRERITKLEQIAKIQTCIGGVTGLGIATLVGRWLYTLLQSHPL